MKFNPKTVFQLSAAVLAATLLLSSCGDGGKNEPADTSTGSTEAVTVTTPDGTAAQSPAQNEPMDMFAAEFDPLQYITPGEYKNFEIVNNVAVSDDELAVALRSLAENNNLFREITDRASVAGDTLNVDYVGRIDGIAFVGGTATGASVSLVDDNGYIPGFIDDLDGVMPGAKVSTTVTFPENYHEPSYAGKQAVFEFTVNFIYDFTLDDATVKEFTDGDYETFEAFRDYYRKSLICENIDRYDSSLENILLEKLFESVTVISLPEEQVKFYYDDQYNYLKSYYDYQYYQYYATFEAFLSANGFTLQSITDYAEQQAKIDIALLAVLRKENIEPSPEEYNRYLAEFMEELEVESESQLYEYYGEAYAKLCVYKEFCLAKLTEWADITTDKAEYQSVYDEMHADAES